MTCDWTRFAIGVGLGVLALAATACAPMLISDKGSTEAGRRYYDSMKAERHLFTDVAVENYVTEVAKKVADESSFRVTMGILRGRGIPKSYPGGFVFIPIDDLQHLEGESELAAIIAHEWGHLLGRHNVSTYYRTSALQILEGLVTVSPLPLPIPRETMFRPMGIGLTDFADDLEKSADAYAAERLKHVGYSPDAMRRVLTNTRVPICPPNSDANCPYDQIRARLKKRMDILAQAQGSPPTDRPGRQDHERYLQGISGLIYYRKMFCGEINDYDHFYSASLPGCWNFTNNQGALLLHQPEGGSYIQVAQRLRSDLPAPMEQLREPPSFATQGWTSAQWINTTPPSAFRQFSGTCPGSKNEASARSGRGALIERGSSVLIVQICGPPGADTVAPKLIQQFLGSLRFLGEASARAAPTLLLRPHRVAPGETLAGIAAKGPLAPQEGEAVLRELNRLPPDTEPSVGDLIKVVQSEFP